MNIKKITDPANSPSDIIATLKRKSVELPSWADLEEEYNPTKHPVMNRKIYPDKRAKGGMPQKVTRVILGWQKLAVKRMAELMFAIPVQRVYKDKTEDEAKAALIMESIFSKNHIDSVNIKRSKSLFASCEAATLWYAQEQPTVYAGEPCALKLRCKTFSPMDGTSLYMLFDEYDDMVAFSLEYCRDESEVGGIKKNVTYFDTYTKDEHIRWRTEDGKTEEEIRENFVAGKIPGIYICRKEPIWEDGSENVYEAEWTLSRNGNYIRKNARPTWVVYSDNKVRFGNESSGDNEGRNVIQYGANDKAGYATWQQAIESIKFHIEELKKTFFMQIQLPDMSMDNLKAANMSGEARKMMFIDAQMKVTDESGDWLEFFEREISVVKSFMKLMYPKLEKAIDSLEVDVVITPYRIQDDTERINNLTNATGGKPVMSQRTAIRRLGYVEDVDEEMEQIAKEAISDLFEGQSV